MDDPHFVRSQDIVVRPDDHRAAAWKLEGLIVETVNDIRGAWITLAQRLYEWQEMAGWEVLGYETLETWLAGPDIDLSRSTYFMLTGAFRDLVVDRGVKPAELSKFDYTRIQEIMPALRRGQETDVRQALADCEVLSRSDLREKYARAPLAGPIKDDPMIDAFHYEKCPTCGTNRKVMDA